MRNISLIQIKNSIFIIGHKTVKLNGKTLCACFFDEGNSNGQIRSQGQSMSTASNHQPFDYEAEDQTTVLPYQRSAVVRTSLTDLF